MSPIIAAAGETPRHVLNELGFSTTRVGAELHGTASITPQMHVPGTSHLRTSILAAWADMLTGLLATQVIAPRVPVTLELDVHLYRPAPAPATFSGSPGRSRPGARPSSRTWTSPSTASRWPFRRGCS